METTRQGLTEPNLTTVVAPGITQIRLPMAGNPLRHINGYLVEDGADYLLVDCGWGTPDVLEALLDSLAHLEVPIERVRTLVVTHHHSDHYGLAGTLVERYGMQLQMHRLDWQFQKTHFSNYAGYRTDNIEWMRRNGLEALDMEYARQETRDGAARFTMVEPARLLDEGDYVGSGQHKLRVVWTPGHTPGHVCLYDEPNRLLLTGDHVLERISSNIGLRIDEERNPLAEYLDSLDKVSQLDVHLVLPAHGEPFTGLRPRVSELLEHHQDRENAVMEVLRRGPASAGEVASNLPWTRRAITLRELPEGQQRLAVGETLSHLELLRSNGVASRSDVDGVWIYAVTA